MQAVSPLRADPQAVQRGAWPVPEAVAPGALAIQSGLTDFRVIRRNGAVVSFEPTLAAASHLRPQRHRTGSKKRSRTALRLAAHPRFSGRPRA